MSSDGHRHNSDGSGRSANSFDSDSAANFSGPELNIPSPVMPSDNDAPPLSQRRLSRKAIEEHVYGYSSSSSSSSSSSEKLQSDQSDAQSDGPPDLASSSGDEDEPAPQRKLKHKSTPDFSSFGAEELAVQFKAMSKRMKVLERQEQEKKQQQKKMSRSREVARDSLSPDSTPRKARKLAIKKPKHAAQVTESYESDYEYDDDMSEQTSSQRTPRPKFQKEWKLIGVKKNSDSTPADIHRWLTETAEAEMNKCGEHSLFRCKQDDLGPFKRAHVSSVHYSLSRCMHISFR